MAAALLRRASGRADPVRRVDGRHHRDAGRAPGAAAASVAWPCSAPMRAPRPTTCGRCARPPSRCLPTGAPPRCCVPTCRWPFMPAAPATPRLVQSYLDFVLQGRRRAADPAEPRHHGAPRRTQAPARAGLPGAGDVGRLRPADAAGRNRGNCRPDAPCAGWWNCAAMRPHADDGATRAGQRRPAALAASSLACQVGSGPTARRPPSSP